MFKILDRHLIKTFFSPFVLIFSVLFFIFIVNIVWIQMAQLTGKGLSIWQIFKLLFYMGVSVISLVMPLTILLASIMTFGEIGEKYELAAMKAAGIPLSRIMRPLFFVVLTLSGILFYFSNYSIPDFQRKARNMLYNIAATKPALNFTAGEFIDQIPGVSVKFDKISGENGENLEGVFIHKMANSYENQQAIVSKKGKFAPAADRNFLKLVLFNGYVFEDDVENKNYNARLKQENQSVKFDTLVLHFDVSQLINQALEKQQITDDYHFQNYGELNATIKKIKKDQDVTFSAVNNDLLMQTSNYISPSEKPKAPEKAVPQYHLEKLPKKQQLDALFSAYNKIETLKTSQKNHETEVLAAIKYQSKVVMYQQKILALSATCIIFFLIGSSLGSIVRKGGFGLPVVIAIFIFIIFYVLNLSVENLAWKGKINSYLAAWLPNIVLFPLGIWLTYKALTDSQVFDAEKYKAFFKPIISRFSKSKEHKRYQ